jgi:hypothetical protein
LTWKNNGFAAARAVRRPPTEAEAQMRALQPVYRVAPRRVARCVRGVRTYTTSGVFVFAIGYGFSIGTHLASEEVASKRLGGATTAKVGVASAEAVRTPGAT